MAIINKLIKQHFLQRSTVGASASGYYYNNSGSAQTAVNDYQLIYTVPAGKNVIVESIFVANHNNFYITYDIAIVPQSQSSIFNKYLYKYDEVIGPNDYQEIRDKLTLSSGDKIYLYSSTDEDISFNIFGTEVS